MKSLRFILPTIILIAGLTLPSAAVAVGASTSIWSPAASMSVPRTGLAAATDSDGRIYAIGGYNTTSGYLASVERYDPQLNSWSSVAPLKSARFGAAAALGSNGRIYVFGGRNSSGYLASVEAYNPLTNAWAYVAPMSVARSGLAAVSGPYGRIFVMGGYNSTSGYLATFQAYNPYTNSWSNGAALPTARSSLAAAVGTDGLIYAIGGTTASGPVRTVERFIPLTGLWQAAPSLIYPRAELAAVTGSDGRIYAIGGRYSTLGHVLTSVEAYQPGTAAWSVVDTMQAGRYGLAAAMGGDGQIYLLGGTSGASGTVLTSVHAYYPVYLPPVTVPAAPAITGVAVSGSSISVSWSTPNNGGSPITGYVVSIYVGSTSTVAATVIAGSTVNSAVLTGLSYGVGYAITVRAENAMGASPESARSAIATLVTTPGVPQSVVAIAGIGTLTVQWVAPASNGGSPITGYIVTLSTGFAGETRTITVGPSVTSIMFDHLINGRTYMVIVVAFDAVGSSLGSTPVSPVTLPNVPAAPVNLTVVPGNTSIQVSWQAPFDCGRPIASYFVTVSDGVHMPVTQQVTATSATFTGLASGTAYTVSVVAVNAVGLGAAVTQAVTLPNLPPTVQVPGDQVVPHDAPLNLTVTTTNPEATDHISLTAAGLPLGTTFTDLGNGTGMVTGYVLSPTGTYTIAFSANDGHNPAVTSSLRVTVTPEEAAVVSSSTNPMNVTLRAPNAAAKTVTLRASVHELTETGSPESAETASVAYTLTGLSSGRVYSGTINAGGAIEAAMESSYTFHNLAPDVYLVKIAVGGSYYEGTTESILTVHSASTHGSVNGQGSITYSGRNGHFQVSARYLANGKIQGTLLYTENGLPSGLPNVPSGVLHGSYVLTGKIAGGLVIKNHGAYFQGTATLDGTRGYRFAVSLLDKQRGGKGSFGLTVFDPNHATASYLAIPVSRISSGSVTVKT